ncbi:tRNA pseudouridine(38-40) synthase TruA [Anaerococcus tetradius]|uniref:tRNA pseudouridine(38-40) synthase TruA n=2 Tax=Anaerococcus tetradius TaxID=33036 RepID=UPI0023F31AA1|nr:tRNA pseudouridine(38-40) synthase TruA [Anaerococcus tetradius]
MIRNVLVETAYDGTNFAGFQYQKDQRSVEEEIKKALVKVTGEDNRIVSCGRTDSGVHAKSHFFNFLTASKIDPKAFRYHLQVHLPADILALSSREVDLSFHARFSCKSKLYKYVIYRGKGMHPIYRNYKEEISYKLDLKRLEEGLKLLCGEHDFRSFMREDKDLSINTVRKIDQAYFLENGDDLEIYFKAESFLHNQVRIMVGSLVELSRGKLSLDDYKRFFDEDYKIRANPALGAQGLYLWRVEF